MSNVKAILSKFTPGIWKIGKNADTVVSDAFPEDYTQKTGHDETDYYGGFLIGESIRKRDVKLISASKDLLYAGIKLLEHAERSGAHDNALYNMKQAIRKAIEE